jgi:hypothetical protein
MLMPLQIQPVFRKLLVLSWSMIDRRGGLLLCPTRNSHTSTRRPLCAPVRGQLTESLQVPHFVLVKCTIDPPTPTMTKKCSMAVHNARRSAFHGSMFVLYVVRGIMRRPRLLHILPTATSPPYLLRSSHASVESNFRPARSTLALRRSQGYTGARLLRSEPQQLLSSI